MLDRMSEEERKEFLEAEAKRVKESNQRAEAMSRTIEESIRQSTSELKETARTLQEQQRQLEADAQR